MMEAAQVAQGGQPAAAAAEPPRPRAATCGISAFPSVQQALAAPAPRLLTGLQLHADCAPYRKARVSEGRGG